MVVVLVSGAENQHHWSVILPELSIIKIVDQITFLVTENYTRILPIRTRFPQLTNLTGGGQEPTHQLCGVKITEISTVKT